MKKVAVCFMSSMLVFNAFSQGILEGVGRTDEELRADIVKMDKEISDLQNSRESKNSNLESCAKKVKGFKIAGISTLSLTAVGIGGNIWLASKNKSLDKQIERKKIEDEYKALATELNVQPVDVVNLSDEDLKNKIGELKTQKSEKLKKEAEEKAQVQKDANDAKNLEDLKKQATDLKIKYEADISAEDLKTLIDAEKAKLSEEEAAKQAAILAKRRTREPQIAAIVSEAVASKSMNNSLFTRLYALIDEDVKLNQQQIDSITNGNVIYVAEKDCEEIDTNKAEIGLKNWVNCHLKEYHEEYLQKQRDKDKEATKALSESAKNLEPKSIELPLPEPELIKGPDKKEQKKINKELEKKTEEAQKIIDANEALVKTVGDADAALAKNNEEWIHTLPEYIALTRAVSAAKSFVITNYVENTKTEKDLKDQTNNLDRAVKDLKKAIDNKNKDANKKPNIFQRIRNNVNTRKNERAVKKQLKEDQKDSSDGNVITPEEEGYYNGNNIV